MKHRSGHSIIELLVVIAISSTVLAMAAVALMRVNQVDALARKSNDLDRTMARLALVFRADCRRSKSVNQPNQPEQRLILTGQSSVEYQRLSNRLVRQEKKGGKTTRESYLIPEDVDLRWQLVTNDKQSLVILRIKPMSATDSNGLAFHAHQIVAAIGTERSVHGMSVQEVQR